jgi:uncharacterized radical SAM superfamily Fe-S cluster-containing enzyme
VYFDKVCPALRPSSALVSESAAYYARAYTYARSGTEPFVRFGNATSAARPTAALCSDHEQHTCLPIVEITDHCNLECPVCIVDNQYSTHLSVERPSRRSSTAWSPREGDLRVDRAVRG